MHVLVSVSSSASSRKFFVLLRVLLFELKFFVLHESCIIWNKVFYLFIIFSRRAKLHVRQGAIRETVLANLAASIGVNRFYKPPSLPQAQRNGRDMAD